MRKLSLLFFNLLLFVLLQNCNKDKNGESEELLCLDTISNSVNYQDSAEIDTKAETIIPPPPKDKYIIIDKTNLKLYLVNKNDTVFTAPICAGLVRGQKQMKDDRRTPEGDFQIINIQDASGWLYHTNDGRWVPKVYGPYFLRLDANGWHGIGIHGTNAPGQIGQRRSKGCIRMKNEDILKLKEMVQIGMRVTILPDIVTAIPKKPTDSNTKQSQDTTLTKTVDEKQHPQKDENQQAEVEDSENSKALNESLKTDTQPTPSKTPEPEAPKEIEENLNTD